MWVRSQQNALAAFAPGQNPGIYGIGGWVGLRGALQILEKGKLSFSAGA